METDEGGVGGRGLVEVGSGGWGGGVYFKAVAGERKVDCMRTSPSLTRPETCQGSQASISRH